jgi:cobalt/nickel transport system ATP-binding protein
MKMIHLKNVSFSYGSKIVLNGMDFELREGKKVALVGANGCGKTTLCHIVMGLLAPQSGDVEILGKERKKESDFSEIRGKIGFLFQDSDDQLFCPTVIEDVAFGPLNLGQTPEQAKKTVTQTLNALKLNGFEDRITYKLSGGEKRLVSLATVLAMEPKYLILDEPTTGLDESTVDRLVMILNDSPLGYLIISHDREFVKRTAKEVFRLKDGKIEPEEKI